MLHTCILNIILQWVTSKYRSWNTILRHHIFIERRKKRFLHIADGRKYYLKFSTSCQESLINPTLQKSVLVSASSKCFENA